MEAAPRSDLTPLRRPIAAFALAWAAQAALAWALPLVADEAYYLAWSRALAPGYLDHPPGVAFWMALGGGHPRLPGLFLLPIAWCLLADAARRFGLVHWAWVPAAVMATPLGFSAGLFVTPDAPLTFFVCAAIWAVAAERPVGVGLALGLALWSKSTALVAIPGFLLVLGPRRGALAAAIALAVHAPHIIWSLNHDGLPWTFQRSLRHLSGLHLPEFIGGQLLVVTPLVAWVAARAWLRPRDALGRRLRALSLPAWLVFAALSLGTRVEANWPAVAWPAALLLVLRHPQARRAFTVAAVLTALAAVGLPILHALAPPGAGPPRDGPALRACLAAATP
ncbi:MAG: hypothetical protein KC620_11680, partial [Myxococcales bacterium]|nr:hypothetical protein [Myxococcales bacterium]